MRKRVEANDPQAFVLLGFAYNDGQYGLAQDSSKAFELWSRAAELGSVSA